MLNEITLKGFKSFVDWQIELKKLTVLTGINSSGKSSVLQALLMLEKASNLLDNVLLKGHGSADDLRNSYSKGNITLSVTTSEGEVLTIEIPPSASDEPYKSNNAIDFPFPEIIYVSANRFGPKSSVPMYNNNSKKNKLGKNGENLFQCIAHYSDHILDSSLKNEKSEGDTLLFNIRGWLSVISPNAEFDFELVKSIDASYSTFDGHRASNVGFGLSYALPVIAALLIGTLVEDSLVIIENPEAHLHPKGQTEIAKLIALCANIGTQVIIETHSDHVFDSIRIMAKNIPDFSDKVQLHWFELNGNKNTQVYSPLLDSNGRVSEWPQGFFDQFEINASKLL